MSQLLKIRLPDGRVLTPSDWGTGDPVYSTVEIPVGNTSIVEAFTYGVGGVVPGSANNRQSTYIDTNLQGEGGRLPENEALVINAIAVEVYVIPPPNTPTVTQDQNVISPDVSALNMLRLQRDLICVLSIASVKEYLKVPLGFFASGAGVESGTASGFGGDGTNGYVAANNGSTSPKGIRRLASPLFVQGGEAFRFKFIPPSGTVAGLDLGGNAASRVRLRTYMLGYHKRPVA